MTTIRNSSSHVFAGSAAAASRATVEKARNAKAVARKTAPNRFVNLSPTQRTAGKRRKKNSSISRVHDPRKKRILKTVRIRGKKTKGKRSPENKRRARRKKTQ